MASAQLTWGLTGVGLGSDLTWCFLGTTPELDSDSWPLDVVPSVLQRSMSNSERGDFCVWPPAPPDQLLTCGLEAAYSTCPSLSFPTRQRGYRRACLGIITSEGGTRPAWLPSEL